MPEVFISHATEDKKRFVEKFAKKLRNDGIDAWYDEWEMRGGDSLTDKVSKAIGKCNVFIVILSSISVEKPWVKEELNAALMQKIKGKLRLIPISIDSDVEIPALIDHLFRFNIENIVEYEKPYKELVMDIWEITKKPPLGEKPSYITDNIHLDLEDVDFLIFEVLGNITKDKGLSFEISAIKLKKLLKKHSLSEEIINDSLDILQERGFITIKPTALTKYIKLTKEGRINFFKYENSYNNYINEIVSAMINEELDSNDNIIMQKDLPISFVEAILEDFKDKNYIKIISSGHIGQPYLLKEFTITGTGKRYFKKLLS